MVLAPDSLLPAQQVGFQKYRLRNFSMSVESISFGNGSYQAMVNARMASNDPLLVPFLNWAGYEGSANMSNITQQ